MSGWSRVLLDLLICAGLLVVMPLGLHLLAAPGVAVVRRWWVLAAAPAAASVWLPRGGVAVALAAAYLPATAALAISAARLLLADLHPRPHEAAGLVVPGRLRRPRGGARPVAPGGLPRPGWAGAAWLLARGRLSRPGRVGAAGLFARGRLPRARTVAAATALVGPAVAAGALVAERGGYRLFGFDLDVLALTVAHFHYAGFAAALVAGLVCRFDGDGRAGRIAALSVPAGVAVVFAGFFTNEWVELAGAAVLTAGMWLVAALTMRQARDAGAAPPTRRAASAPTRHAAAAPTRHAASAPTRRGGRAAAPTHQASVAPTSSDGGAAAPTRHGGGVAAPTRHAGWMTLATTRGLLVTSALTLGATMLLALDWALGRAAGLPHLPISWMVATHGLANALGFALCAILAWQRIERGSEWG